MRANSIMSLHKYNSFNSDISESSILSDDSLIDMRREDPEEILMSLGFGFMANEQPYSRIPRRFLESKSSAKGISVDEMFPKRGSLQFSDHNNMPFTSNTETRERSYSFGRKSDIMSKLVICEANDETGKMSAEMPEIRTTSASNISPDSILNPANRHFLENQGKQEDQNRLGSKRLIIGTKSYKLDGDGDPVAMPKTPSPIATTPVPSHDDDTELSDSNDQNTACDSNSEHNLHPISSKNKCLQRQTRISDETTELYDNVSMINDMSSELSSSTATLVDSVIYWESEGTNTYYDRRDSMRNDKRDVHCQTDCDTTTNRAAIESAFIVAIQSMRLSLEFYKLNSLNVATISARKNCFNCSEQDMQKISQINSLIGSIMRELVDMDELLNTQFSAIKTSSDLSSIVMQAQVFTQAVEKMTDLLKEQQNIYSRIDIIESNGD